MPRKINFENRIINVPDDATDEEIQSIIGQSILSTKPKRNEGKQSNNGPVIQSQESKEHPYREAFRKLIGENLVDTFPILGSYFGPAGTAAGSATKTAFKSAAPTYFGEHGDIGDSVLEMGKDVTINSLIPKAIGGTIKAAINPKEALVRAVTAEIPKGVPFIGGKSVANTSIPGRQALQLESAKSELANALEQTKQSDLLTKKSNEFNTLGVEKRLQPETSLLEQGAGIVDQRVSDLQKIINDKNATQQIINKEFAEYEAKYGSNSLAKGLLQLGKDVEAGTSAEAQQSYRELAERTTSDISQTRNMIMAAGPEVTKGLHLNELINKGYDKSTQSFNPEKILKELDGVKNEIYSEGLGQELDSFKEFLNTSKVLKDRAAEAVATSTQRLNEAEKNVLAIENTKSGLIQYAKKRLLFGLPFAVTGSLIPGTAFSAGLVFTDAMIGRAMQNKQTAQILVNAMKTPLKSPESGFYTQMLLDTFKGMNVMVQTADDKLQKAYVNEDGQLQYSRP